MTRAIVRPRNQGPLAARLVAIALLASLALVYDLAEAQTIEYLLRGTSQVSAICSSCEDGRRVPEELHGTFDLTVMPIPDAHTIEAVTSIHWYSKSYRISGTGFLERLGRNRLSMVVDAVVNGEAVLLTSTSHPTEGGGSVRLSLTTAPDSPVAISIDLIAFANNTTGPDADRDGIPDALDLCPTHPENAQEDSDYDGVGDACDTCPETPLGVPTLTNGCSLGQSCPCVGPGPDLIWKSQREYLTCVARALKQLVSAEEITRAEARSLVHAGARSGCGTPLIALLPPQRHTGS